MTALLLRLVEDAEGALAEKVVGFPLADGL
jgi:hypothetical protein